MMTVCKYCGEEFSTSSARRSIARRYGAGAYDDYYPSGDVCLDCAIEEISADYNEGDEVLEECGYWGD